MSVSPENDPVNSIPTRTAHTRDFDAAETRHFTGSPPHSVGRLPEVPGYTIERELARGGMGVVYAATDLALRREVVVKTLRPEYAGQPDTTRLFEKETWITGQLAHPGVPPVHACGVLPDGRPFLAMKLIRGRTLAELLAKGADETGSQLPRLIQVFEQVCQTVGFAHNKGIIHRDLKPQNIMVGEFGEVQVMDWGLAKQVRVPDSEPAVPTPPQPAAGTSGEDALEAYFLGSEAAAATLAGTRFGTVRGTPAYMPPEQARGLIDEIDRRSDVFALGGILCAILTGKPPIAGRSSGEVLQRARECDTAAATTALEACGADAALISLAKHSLQRQKTERPADARAVAAVVTAYRAGVEKRLRKAETDRATAAVHAAVERNRQQLVRRLLRTVTTLVVGLSTFAVVLVSWLTYIQSKSAFVEKGVSELRVDTSRQASDIQREVFALGVGVRTFATRLGEKLGPVAPRLADGTNAPDFDAWWKRELPNFIQPRKSGGEPAGVRFDGGAIERVTLFDLVGKQVGFGVVRAGTVERFQTETGGVSGPVEALVNITLKGGEGSHSVAESTAMLLEDEGGAKVCRFYIARRVFLSGRQGKGGTPLGALVLQVNLTHYLTEMTRRAARHSYFLLDSDGAFLFHPDAARVGKKVAKDDALGGFERATWGGDWKAVEDELTANRGDVIPANRSATPAARISGLEYYHAKKRVPTVSDARLLRVLCETFNTELAELARRPASDGGAGPGFRYAELTPDTPRVEISHATKDGLERAKGKIDEILSRDWPAPQPRFRERALSVFGAPGANWYDAISCDGFVAQLTLLNLGLGTPMDGSHPPTPGGYVSPRGVPRLVSAAAVAELEQDAVVAINPSRNAIVFIVFFVGAVLALVLARTVTRPLRRFAQEGTDTTPPTKRS